MTLPGLIEELTLDEAWLLLDAATLGVFKWSVEEDVVRWSPLLHATLGTQPGHAGINQIGDIVHPHDLEHFRHSVFSTQEPGGRYVLDCRIRKSDGQYVWASANGLWLPASGDRVDTLLGFITDIQARRTAEEALRRSESRFRSFLDRCPAGVYIKDPEGRHLYGNTASARIAGVPLNELIGSL
ncbi:MAG: PAS domain-containing protein, partial [Myxococcota bacterium]